MPPPAPVWHPFRGTPWILTVGEAEPLPGRVQSTGRKHRFSATEKRRQIPVEEETDPWDPYHRPWSGCGWSRRPHNNGSSRVVGC